MEEDFSHLRHQAILQHLVDLTLYSKINLKISHHHFLDQTQIKILSNQHSSLVYLVHHSSRHSSHKVVLVASSHLSNLDSKIQLNLQALQVCSDHLLVVQLTRHLYSVLKLVLLQDKLLDCSLHLEAHRQVLETTVSSLQKQVEPNLVYSLPPQDKILLFSDHQQVQEMQESLAKHNLNQVLGACFRLRPAHSSRIMGYSNKINRLSNQVIYLLLPQDKVVSRIQE